MNGGQASGSGSLHPPEEFEEPAVAPLLAVTLPVVLAPPAPPTPSELPDPLGCSTVGPHATSVASSETAAWRAKGVIIQR